tara:strand:- start:1712 stop:1873 length:162 start_codon:yes stop_codon:yes gene_type:complete
MAGDNRETGFSGIFFLPEQEARENKKTAAWPGAGQLYLEILMYLCDSSQVITV